MSWGQGALLTGWTIRWLGLDGGLLLGVLNYLAQSALFAATGKAATTIAAIWVAFFSRCQLASGLHSSQDASDIVADRGGARVHALHALLPLREPSPTRLRLRRSFCDPCPSRNQAAQMHVQVHDIQASHS